jgi:hypothetical protein
MDTGLAEDANFVLSKANATMKTFSSRQSLNWRILPSMVPDPIKVDNTTSYVKVVYTLWVHMMIKILEDKNSSTAWLKPEPMPFFQHNREEWLNNYTVSFFPCLFYCLGVQCSTWYKLYILDI